MVWVLKDFTSFLHSERKRLFLCRWRSSVHILLRIQQSISLTICHTSG